jgi:hypothetical protein
MSAAEDFLRIAADFQLGSLETEMQHPLTTDLSRLANENLPEALRLMREVDLLALKRFENAREGLTALATAIGETFAKGKTCLSLRLRSHRQALAQSRNLLPARRAPLAA